VWEIEAMLLKTVDEFIATITVQGMEPLIKRYRKDNNTKKDVEAGIITEVLSNPLYANVPPEAIKLDLLDTKVEIRVHRLIVGKKLIKQKNEKGEELDEIENPYGEDPDGDPVLKLNLLKHSNTKTAYPTCPTTFALPINREKNKRRSQHIYLTSKLNHPVIKEKGEVKWIGKAGGLGARVKLGQTGDVEYMQGQVATQDFLIHDRQCDNDIDDQYDTPDVIRGKNPPNANDQSGRAIANLQDFAGVMSAPFIRKYEAFVVRIGRSTLSAMLKYWKRHQWEALIDETDWKTWLPDEQRIQLKQQSQGETDLQPNEQYVKKQWTDALNRICPIEDEPDIDIMDIDIKVTAGSSMPTSRIAKNAEALEKVKMGLLDPETYWEQTDDSLKDKVIPRLKQQAQAKSASMPEKINVTINLKDMPPEAQTQLLEQINIKMNPQNIIPPGTGTTQ
jgi:hypothetical protein